MAHKAARIGWKAVFEGVLIALVIVKGLPLLMVALGAGQ